LIDRVPYILFFVSLFFISCDITETKIVKHFTEERNVLNKHLQECCLDPVTGYFRDGLCKMGNDKYGTHLVCARMTKAFLDFSRSRGNDLTSQIPGSSFPGLSEGDKWCLDIHRWKEALDAGVAPPIYLESCNEKLLDYIAIDTLRKYALNE